MADAIAPTRPLPSDVVRRFMEKAAVRFGGVSPREAARLSGRVVQPLVDWTPLGMADDAVQASRDNAAAFRRGETVPALGGTGTAMAALGAVPGGRVANKAMKAFHAGPAGLQVLKPSVGGAVGPGLYVASSPQGASYWGMRLGDDAHVYEVDIPKGPYASKTQFFQEVKKLGGATLENIDQVHAEAAKRLAERGFVGIRNGKETAVFNPDTAVKIIATDNGGPSGG